MPNEVWVEKYRAKSLDEIEGQPQIIERLRNIIAEGNMPNFLISGPPGTGKTTTMLVLAHELLGSSFRTATIELNASDDRGIDVVRDKIKSFAKEKIDLPPGRHKIVILDECDSMTEAAQQALRRLMEVYSGTTRFALACNQSTKIIEPIQSRCAIIRYGRLKDHQILRRLLHICAEEKVDYVDSGLEALIFSAEGDMRNAINNLQSTVNGFGLVNRENVTKVCDMPPPEAIKCLVKSCLEGRWREAHDTAMELIDEGYSALDIIIVMKSVLRRAEIGEAVGLEFLKIASRFHYLVTDGVPSNLQLDAMLASLCNAAAQFAHATKCLRDNASPNRVPTSS